MNGRRGFKLVWIIFGKCLKMVFRNHSNQLLFLLSVMLVYGGLWLMWILTSQQNVSYLSSEPYAKLRFDFTCSATNNDGYDSFTILKAPHLGNKSIGIECTSVENLDDISAEPQTSPSDVLLQWLYTGSPVTDDDRSSIKLLELISSLVMNGIPLVGLDGYVEISDAANRLFGKKLEGKILASATLREQFDGFFHVRNKRLIITPDNYCTSYFISEMKNNSKIFNQLNIEVQDDIDMVLESPNCCSDIWAIIELVPAFPSTEKCNLSIASNSNHDSGLGKYFNSEGNLNARPSVTIRMNPSAVPDTRNFDWTPLKRVSSRFQSGELLYFTSGFLSLQLELQQFIEKLQFGHSITRIPSTSVDWKDSIVDHHSLMLDVAAAIVNSTTVDEFRSEIKSIELLYRKDPKLGSSVHFPLYHRAFPTRGYTESLFWHLFGTLMTIALIILFVIPAAITLGCFKKESIDGQLDVLSTIPWVKTVHSFEAWYAVAFCGVATYGVLGYIFFRLILVKSSAFMPILGLLFMGISLVPIFGFIGDGFRKPDSLILAVPAFTFISVLPGLLYYDLAYDTQRSFLIELLLSLLPPSGVAILLRLCFNNEAVGISVGWFHRAPVSNTPAWFFVLVLFCDSLFWFWTCSLRINEQEGRKQIHAVVVNRSLFSRVWNWTSSVLFSWLGRHGYTQVSDEFEHTHFGNDTVAIEVSDVTKYYQTGSDSICVLDKINAQLSCRQITVLLGSNGAGKTTLMKILAGLDTSYSGIVRLMTSDTRAKRIIGWCPQSDSLYPFLTVNEHLEFFESLMECSTTQISSYSVRDRIQISLQNLAMIEHRETPAFHLSGGMKRRLSLALAFVGTPAIILLDEPTSGCDSWTRELVRRDILSRKTTSCIVVSTHHSDDVEVLADKVWFLNERNLVIDKAVEDLFADKEDHRFAEFSRRPIKFSTTTLFIKSQFIRFFGEALSLALQPVGVMHDNPPYSWTIPPSYFQKLISFVKHLDNLQERDWTLEHYTVFSAISSYYGQRPASYQNTDLHKKEFISHGSLSYKRYSVGMKSSIRTKWIRNMFVMIRIRLIDLKKHPVSFILSHIMLPFCVAYFLAIACRDISYPKVRITSDNFHSIGEVPIAAGCDGKQINTTKLLSKLPEVSWEGKLSSDELWNKLYEEYYQHSKTRWGAMVVDDFSPDWLESSLLINKSSMKLSPSVIVSELSKFCNSSVSYRYFCDKVTVQQSYLNESYIQDSHFTTVVGVTVASHEDISTNFTLMSNVTNDHAAPVFVKEILAPVVSIVNGDEILQQMSPSDPQYDLFSFPLPDSNVVNKRYLERGFLGSTLATMYLLMTIVSCVKFITKLNGSKIKRQLHGTGVSPFEYWISNWLFDVSKVFCAELAILLGIYCGGNPIAGFFFYSTGIHGILTISAALLFSMAVVSSSFAMVMLWEDQLASQLFILLTTISGGLFLKMYLDRHHSIHFEILSNICILVSPAFSFTTIMFDIFKAYAHDAVKGSSLQYSERNYENSALLRSHYCCGVLFVQSIAYLALCIIIDYYQIRILHFLKSIRWNLSAQWMCADIHSMLQETECSSRVWKSSLNAVQSSDVNDEAVEWNDSLQNLTISAGNKMREQLTSHPDYRVGIFPFVTRSAFRSSSSKSASLKQCEILNELDCQGDIEMSSLLPSASTKILFPTDEMVDCRDLCVDGHSSADLKLSLCNVSFKLPLSSRIAIMSMNGGGKTSLFETLTGSRLPMHGSVKLFGKDVVSDRFQIGENALVGYVPQEDAMLEFLTVQETMEIFSNLDGQYDEHISMDRTSSLDFLPCKFNHHPVYALSGGTKKKLSLGVANMTNPKLLLLDECTTGVDPISATSIVDYLQKNINFQSQQTFSQGLMFASHRVDEAFALCDEVLMLVNGQVFLKCPSSAFVELVHRYYQVDVYVCVESCADNVRDIQQSFLSRLYECVGGKTSIERIVIYGQALIRLTFRKSEVSVTKLWNKLDMWRYHGLVTKYLFRTMEMEEVLATILAASKMEECHR